MAKDVHQALIEILQGPEELNRTKLEATQLLMELTQEGRYLRDLVSFITFNFILLLTLFLLLVGLIC
jgi:hypothetical protein